MYDEVFDRINRKLHTNTWFEFVESLNYPNPQDGYIAYQGDGMYLYYGSEWHKMETSNECCNVKTDTQTHPRICSRCGAPLTSCKCDYCGTMYV